jgi:hypothetical protein
MESLSILIKASLKKVSKSFFLDYSYKKICALLSKLKMEKKISEISLTASVLCPADQNH